VAGLNEALSDRVTALARRVETAPDPNRARRAEQLRRHVAEHLAPRAADLSAPLVVVLLGSTGVGKSSPFNAIAGAPLANRV
jgi:predicted GTPase